MRKIGLLMLVAVFLTLLIFTPGIRTIAQDAKQLKVGEMALGELTKAAPQAKFTFSGKKGEVYVAAFSGTGKGSLGADLTILDSSGKTIRKSNLIGDSILAELPADGDFTLNVKSTFSNEGPFAVQLYRLSKLEKGQAVDAEITMRQVTDGGKLVGTGAYYLVQSDADFTLSIKLGEQAFPQTASASMAYNLSRTRKGSLGSLEPVYSGSGDKFVALAVTLKGSPEVHVLAIIFNGFLTTGKLTKDDVLSQKLSLKVNPA